MVPLADRVVELAPKAMQAEGAPVRIELAAREVLFEQGSRGDRVYVVESGRIELVRACTDGSEEALDVVGPGGYFGELAPLLGYPRAATARAAERATVTGYTVQDFREMLGSDRASDLLGAGGRRAIAGRASAKPRRSGNGKPKATARNGSTARRAARPKPARARR
jgi:putative ABC transport system ATP-binding protein